MTKQELLAWVQSLPDDLEWHPIDLFSIEQQSSDWEFVPNAQAALRYTTYSRNVETTMNLRISFKEQWLGEFTRERGFDEWLNLRRVN